MNRRGGGKTQRIAVSRMAPCQIGAWVGEWRPSSVSECPYTSRCKRYSNRPNHAQYPQLQRYDHWFCDASAVADRLVERQTIERWGCLPQRLAGAGNWRSPGRDLHSIPIRGQVLGQLMVWRRTPTTSSRLGRRMTTIDATSMMRRMVMQIIVQARSHRKKNEADPPPNPYPWRSQPVSWEGISLRKTGPESNVAVRLLQAYISIAVSWRHVDSCCTTRGNGGNAVYCADRSDWPRPGFCDRSGRHIGTCRATSVGQEIPSGIPLFAWRLLPSYR